MKTKAVIMTILALLLTTTMIATAQAQGKYKQVFTDRYENIVGDERWVVTTHTTMIIWDKMKGDNLYEATITGIEVMRLYKYSTGELAAKIKFSMTYTGIIDGAEGPDPNAMYTGTYVMSWVAIPVHEDLIPEGDYDTNGRIVRRFVEGTEVWNKVTGEMWWL